jgi:HlyD family secretion protein
MAQAKKKKWLIWVIIGVIVLLVALAVIQAKNRPAGELVEIEKVERRTIYETVSASGKVFPEKEIKISSDISGEVVELNVAEGDSVKAGEVLARIDPEAIQSQVERGQAAVNNAKASLAMARANIQTSRGQIAQVESQLKNARQIYQRNKQLQQDGILSTAELEASLANVEQLEANLTSAQASRRSSEESARAAEFTVNSAEASLRELRTNLQRTTIFAPANGIISRLSVEKGERVVGTIQMTGTELMRIANLSAMEVQVEVSENDIIRVSLGDTADIEVDAYFNRKFKGTVTEIANSAANIAAAGASLTSDQVTNFIVKIRMDHSSYDDLITPGKSYPFRPGMSATVDIYTNSAEGILTVPIQAVTTREEKEGKDDEKKVKSNEFREVVFAVSGDTLALVDVKTGIQDAEYIEITEGLEEGQEIVVGPYAAVSRKLKSGNKYQRKKKDDKEQKESE